MNPYGQVAGVTSEDQTTQEGTTATTDTGTSAAGVNNFTFSQAFGFFNILVGLMLVAAFLSFFGGFTAYLTRLGLESRMQGLRYMYWGSAILFVLIVLLTIVNFLQFNPAVVFGIIAVLIVIFGAWAIVKASQESGEEEEER